MARTTPEEIAIRLARAVEQYNSKNPDNPITEADIRNKSRKGLAGKALLFCEGVWDGLTDAVPENIARLFRHGEIGSRPDDWREDVIGSQRQDRDRRIASYEEATGDESAAAAYGIARDIPFNVLAGLPGALAGSMGGVPGIALGSGATVSAAMGSIARDRFMEEMHRRFMAENGREPTRFEAAQLNSLAKNEANAYAREQAMQEGIAQAATAAPGGWALNKIMNAGGGQVISGLGRKAAWATVKAGENVAGEVASPDKAFAGEDIYRGLNFRGGNGINLLGQENDLLPYYGRQYLEQR